MRRALSILVVVTALGLLACGPGEIGPGGGGSSSPVGTGGGSGTSGTTGAANGSLCAPCSTDIDCGEPGLALCEPQGNGGGACLPSCSDDSDCDAAARCGVIAGQRVCVPDTGSCIGFQPGGVRDGGAGEETSSSSGSSGSGSSGSTASGSSSSGSTASSSTSGSSGSSGRGASSGGSSGSTGRGASSGGSSGSSGSGSTTSGVGLHGGSVHLLHFLITGDTRPPACGDTAHYPTSIIDKIADAATAANAQFALDMGDHMFVCSDRTAPANAQMALYMGAVGRFANPWFMTEGNHECMGSDNGHCLLDSQNANYLAFMNALRPVASKPYYKIDIQTSLGLARFVFVADNSWSSAQETWLKNTLTYADAHAKYTIVVKHHPAGNTSVAANATIIRIIRAHKFALLLTGHLHDYQHPSGDNGREIILGIGGAPLHGATNYHGYAMVNQKANGNLRVTVYNLATGLAQDAWSVGPN